MTITDFTDCRFIENCMRYSDIQDFAKISKILKLRFKAMKPDAKYFYKYYVYAHTNTTDKEKNIIWEYLNDDRQNIITYIEYLNKKRKCDII